MTQGLAGDAPAGRQGSLSSRAFAAPPPREAVGHAHALSLSRLRLERGDGILNSWRKLSSDARVD